MPFFINLLQPAKCPPDVDVVFFFIYIFPAQGKQFTQTNSGTDCKGYEFAKQEMEDNDVKPSAEGYGTDVPDGLCYQWAEEYFKDLNAKEDRGQEEKFVPKPYYGGRSSTTKKAEKKKAEKPAAKAEEKPADTPTEAAPLDEQISFDSLGVSA